MSYIFQLTNTAQSLKAKLTAAPATTNPIFGVAWLIRDTTTLPAVNTPANATGALNGATAVTLVAAPSSDQALGVMSLYIGNVDTAPVTVLLGITDGSGDHYGPYTIPAGETLWLPVGPPGIAGIDGADGSDGAMWYHGSSTPSSLYNNGDLYLDTTTWYLYQQSGGAWGSAICNIRGAAGAAGTAGADGANGGKWYTGSAVPSALHNDGDFYLRSNGDVYQQVSGAWGSVLFNIKGATGAAGADGAPGAAGPTALTVNAGVSGTVSGAWGHCYQFTDNGILDLPSPAGHHGEEILMLKPTSANTWVGQAPTGVYIDDSTAAGTITHTPSGTENKVFLRVIAVTDTLISVSSAYGSFVTA